MKTKWSRICTKPLRYLAYNSITGCELYKDCATGKIYSVTREDINNHIRKVMNAL